MTFLERVEKYLQLHGAAVWVIVNDLQSSLENLFRDTLSTENVDAYITVIVWRGHNVENFHIIISVLKSAFTFTRFTNNYPSFTIAYPDSL